MKENDVKELNDMSVLSKKKRGRPVKWTPENIEKLADELTEFASKKNSLSLVPFIVNNGFSQEILPRLALLSPVFSKALYNAKLEIGHRREQLAYLKKGSEKIFLKTQRMYDPEYHASQIATLKEEELIKAEAKIEALKKQLAIEKEKGENNLAINIVKYADKL